MVRRARSCVSRLGRAAAVVCGVALRRVAVRLGAEFKWACVEASVGLVVDPRDPGLSRCDLLSRGLETGVSSELRRGADGRVEALAHPVLLDERRVEPLDRVVVLLIRRVERERESHADFGPLGAGPNVQMPSDGGNNEQASADARAVLPRPEPVPLIAHSHEHL